MDSVQFNHVENPARQEWPGRCVKGWTLPFCESKQILDDSSWLQFSLSLVSVLARSVGRQIKQSWNNNILETTGTPQTSKYLNNRCRIARARQETVWFEQVGTKVSGPHC